MGSKHKDRESGIISETCCIIYTETIVHEKTEPMGVSLYPSQDAQSGAGI